MALGNKKQNKGVVLITGASSGIGEALTACFAKGGYDLVLVARSVDKLNALAANLIADHKVKVWVEPADLSQPGAAKGLAERLAAKKIAIEILVNNAGVLEQGAFADIPAQRHQELIDLNISGLTSMLAYFVPAMRERGSGRILNVASIAAFQPVPGLATYAATKAYVLSLTESLSEELKGSGVTVTALCPGITATNMVSSVQDANSRIAKLPGFLIGKVDEVAKEAYEACLSGDVIKVPGVINWATIVAGRATPKWLLRRITGVLGRQTI